MASLEEWGDALAALKDCLGSGPLGVGEVEALRVVARRQPLSAGELAVGLSLPPSRVTALVRSLIELDVVAERVSPKDRRRSLLRVTARGENVLFELTQALGADGLDCCFAIAQHLRQAARRARERGAALTVGQVALLALAREQELLSVGTAATCLGMGQSSVSMATRALRRRGLVALRPSPQDRRQHLIGITAEGQRLLSAIYQKEN